MRLLRLNIAIPLLGLACAAPVPTDPSFEPWEADLDASESDGLADSASGPGAGETVTHRVTLGPYEEQWFRVTCPADVDERCELRTRTRVEGAGDEDGAIGLRIARPGGDYEVIPASSERASPWSQVFRDDPGEYRIGWINLSANQAVTVRVSIAAWAYPRASDFLARDLLLEQGRRVRPTNFEAGRIERSPVFDDEHHGSTGYPR